MNLARVLGGALIAGAAFGASSVSPVAAQTAGAYEVRKGEGLYAIAGKYRYDGVTRFQVVIAIYRANQDVFPDGNLNVLRAGQVLRIPSREEIAAVTPAEAARQWQSLTANPAPPGAPIASVKPTPLVSPLAKPPPVAPLPPEAAARRYRDGLALERRGDLQGALAAFLEAGEGGNGLAQRKLGQIYDKGNAVVPRDYEVALKWYQKAREQGIDIEKPLQRIAPR